MIKSKRNIPYGYLMKNGKIVFDPVESQIVINIYQSYIQNECSFTDIATLLNSRDIIYSEDRPKWDKNKIARIIGDWRYVGEKGYPELITIETIKIAENKRAAKQPYNSEKKIDNICLTKLKPRIVCGECGGIMRRQHESHCIIKNRWYCVEEACNVVIPVEDEKLNKSVLFILNQLISSGGALPINKESRIPEYEMDSESCAENRKIESEIMRLLDAASFEKENLIQLIFESASMKYSAISGNEVKTELMIIDLLGEVPLTALSREIMNKFVSEVRLFEDGIIELVLINGWTLREDTEYGNEDTIADETRARNTA